MHLLCETIQAATLNLYLCYDSPRSGIVSVRISNDYLTGYFLIQGTLRVRIVNASTFCKILILTQIQVWTWKPNNVQD